MGKKNLPTVTLGIRDLQVLKKNEPVYRISRRNKHGIPRTGSDDQKEKKASKVAQIRPHAGPGGLKLRKKERSKRRGKKRVLARGKQHHEKRVDTFFTPKLRCSRRGKEKNTYQVFKTDKEEKKAT